MENHRIVTKSRFQRAKFKVVFNKLIYLVNECTQFLDESKSRYVRSKAIELKAELTPLLQRGFSISENFDSCDSHSHLKSKFYDHAPMGFLILNSSASIIDYNNKTKELWGMAEGSLRGASFFSLLDARHGIRFNQTLREVRVSREDRSFECFCRRLDGKSFFARFHISVADETNFESGMVLVSILDITRDLATERIIRSIAKQASTESESEYIRHLGRLLASIDETQVVVIAIRESAGSDKFQVYHIEKARRSGLSSLTYQSKLSYSDLQDQISDGLPKSIHQQLLGCICPGMSGILKFGLNSYITSEESGEVLGHLTLFFKERPREFEHYQDLLNLVAHRITQETIRYVIIENQKRLNHQLESMVASRTKDLHDKASRLELEIDARKEIEEKLIHAKRKAELSNRAKSQFLANMSHEIRTPLNGILGIASILKKTSSKKKRDEYIRIVNQSGKVLLRIIDDILDLARLEAGQLQVIAAEFNLRQTLLDIYHSHEPETRKKGLELFISFPFNHPDKIVGDEIRIRQIIDNLVSNAIKFTDHGQIRVEVRIKSQAIAGKAMLRVRVIDTGPGLSKEQKEVIWRRFERLDHSTTRKTDGFGLGLPVTVKLLKLMKGRITLDTDLNKGCCFDLLIPIGLINKEKRSIPKLTDTHVIVENEDFAKYCIPLLRSLSPAINCHQRITEKMLKDCAHLVLDRDAVQSLSTRVQRLIRQMIKHQNLRVYVVNEAAVLPSKISSLYKQFHMDWLLHGIDDELTKRAKKTNTINREPLPPYTNVKVLLAEDNEINQRVSADMLKILGISVEIASNGIEAVEKMRSGYNCDLILMDCFMPEMDGVEAMKLIKSEYGADTKIIAVTANAIKGEKERYLDQGFDDYLSKPFQFADLQQMVAKYLH